MAASATSRRISPDEINQAVQTIVSTVNTTPLATLFKRSIEIPDENRVKRNIAFALLTGAGFESKRAPKMGGFGGVATDSCKQAIVFLRDFYRNKNWEHLLNQRIALYKIFKQNLNSTFGKEKTDIIPRSLDVKRVKIMRKILYSSGYSLRMAQTINKKILPPIPFYSVVEPLLQKQQRDTVDLPNDWLADDGTFFSSDFKLIFFDQIYNRLFHPEGVILDEAEYSCRCPSSLSDFVLLFFCKIPVRLQTRSGLIIDGNAPFFH
ncbi:MAG: hypothetical protein K2P51_01135 [Rhabdochlamydiaceae bacterium]|nr:hypothetical protein [Rhabdochlamydiaceae bacterium]